MTIHTPVEPWRLDRGHTVRLERDTLAIEGVIERFENGNLVWLVGFDHAFNIVEEGKSKWKPHLIGRPEPEPFSVIRYPERHDRVAYVRREDGSWARIPHVLDSTNHDYRADRQFNLSEIVDRHGWDWDLVGLGQPLPKAAK